MNNAEVLIKFKADTKDVDQKTLTMGKLIKGNLISSAILGGLSAVAGGISRITSGIVNLAVQGGFDRALQIEQAEFKLRGLGKTEEEVEEISKNALASVKGTAYGLDEAMTVAASATAAGVKPGKELERTLKLVADSAAISGRSMTDMGAIFNKVAASGKLTGQELNQLTDAGIPMLQLLADTLGLTTEEVQKLVSSGQIGFAEFQNAIEKGMGGAALTMGQTFQGALENTKAAMSRLGKTFMEPFLKGITPALGTLTEIIDMVAEGTTEGLKEKTEKLGEELLATINGMIEKLTPLIQNVIPILSQLLQSIIGALPELLNTLVPILIDLALDIIDALVDALPNLIPPLINGIIQAVMGLLKIVPKVIDVVIKGALEIVKALAEALPELLPAVIDAVIGTIIAIVDNIPLILKAGIELFMGLVKALPTVIQALIQALPELITSIINMMIEYYPALLEGAIDMLMALVEALPDIIIALVEALPTIIKAIAEALVNGAPKLFEAGKNLLMKIVEGIKSLFSKIWDIGKDLVMGLWNGIGDHVNWIIGKVKGFGNSVMKAIKGIFGIHSPSKEFEFVGKMNVLGLEKGMEDMQPELQKTIDGMFNLQPNVSGTMRNSYSPNLNVVVNNNMEMDPLGQVVNKIKTFSGGAKNDYNWGATL